MSTNALRGCSEVRKLSKRSNCRIWFRDKRNSYKYHNSMTGRTQSQLSSQNVAGFSNISDFPSNGYKHKLYRHTTNVLTTSLAIAQSACTGRDRTLYAAPSTPITWSSRSGKTLSRCQTHSLKSMSHENFYRCTKTCVSLYFDNSASDDNFPLLCCCAHVWCHTCRK